MLGSIFARAASFEVTDSQILSGLLIAWEFLQEQRILALLSEMLMDVGGLG